MFFRIYIMTIKTMFRNRDALLWMLAFPLIMSTLFTIAFGGLDEAYMLNPIGVAVVDGEYEKEFSAALDSVSDGDDKLFNVTEVKNENEATELLKSGAVKGYIYTENGKPAAKVSSEGLDQTVIKEFLDSYTLTKNRITRIIESDPSNIAKISELVKTQDFTKAVPASSNEQTEVITYFYALLAMACMYGGQYGQMLIERLQANLSPLGARRCVAPLNHMKIFFAELAAAVTVHCFNLAVALFYILFVLKLDFGEKIPAIALTCFAGILVGIMFGAFVSSLTKFKSTVKTAIITTVTMFCCFFAGLMMAGIDYAVRQNHPVLSMLNPAARISDALYCLYYYDDYNKFIFNIIILFVMAAVMFVGTVLAVRRHKYESI